MITYIMYVYSDAGKWRAHAEARGVWWQVVVWRTAPEGLILLPDDVLYYTHSRWKLRVMII